MDFKIKEQIRTLVQERINQFHTTEARAYASKTPNGTLVQRIGMSVYLSGEISDQATGEKLGDKQVTAITKALKVLSEEGKAGHPDPIIVDVDGTKFVVVSGQLSTEETNFSGLPKVILADHMVSSNAEVDQTTRMKSIEKLQAQRESNKFLKAEVNALKPKLQTVTEEEFNDLLK